MSDFAGQILGAIDRQLDERQNSFETAIPGEIISVRNDGRIDVAPSIRKMVTSGVIDAFDSPIRGVPVMQIGFSGFSFDLELQKGDSVILLFFSRDASNWKSRKWGQSDPKSPFANDLNNCVAIPYVRPDSGAKVVVRIDKDGVVTFDTDRVNITGDLVVKGKVDVVGDVVAGATITDAAIVETGGVSLQTHMHPTAVPGPASLPIPKAG